MTEIKEATMLTSTHTAQDHPGALRVRLPGSGRFGTINFEDSAFIGRDPDCDLRFDTASISHLHAELYRVGDLWWVRDLGSTEGTLLDDEYVDAAPVIGPCALQLGPGGPMLWLQPSLDLRRCLN